MTLRYINSWLTLTLTLTYSLFLWTVLQFLLLYILLIVYIFLCCHLILSVNWRHIHWLSFGKEENKGSVLLWYSCFDRSILMFLMREGLQCRISILISWLLFSPLPKLGQLSGCDVSWPRECSHCSSLERDVKPMSTLTLFLPQIKAFICYE